MGSDSLDAQRFDQLVVAGVQALGTGDYDHARSRLVEGLGLWRGSPLAELADEASAQPEIADAQRESIGAAQLPFVERWAQSQINVARGALDPPAFDRAWQVGRSMEPAAAVARALHELNPVQHARLSKEQSRPR